MAGKKSEFPNDRTEGERRKNLTDRQVKELELAGGVEGGMQAGNAGGPRESEAQSRAENSSTGPDKDTNEAKQPLAR
jgi:hypothetical protein